MFYAHWTRRPEQLEINPGSENATLPRLNENQTKPNPGNDLLPNQCVNLFQLAI